METIACSHWDGAGRRRSPSHDTHSVSALHPQIIKNEPLEITYSYWDGTGHRRKIAVRKGDTIAEFLRAVRDQVRLYVLTFLTVLTH